METINTHHMIVGFGKHKGELWTRVPKNYLTWLVNEPSLFNDDTIKNIAKAELDRRGTVMKTDLEVSGHAIDRASLKCGQIWATTKQDKNEGIYSWLTRVANEALKERPKQEEIYYKGLKLVFAFGEYYPTLKSVMPSKFKSQCQSEFMQDLLESNFRSNLEKGKK